MIITNLTYSEHILLVNDDSILFHQKQKPANSQSLH